MVARVNTVAFLGMEVITVDVQVQMASGLPTFTVVALPDKAVTESRERVRAAIGALGLGVRSSGDCGRMPLTLPSMRTRRQQPGKPRRTSELL